jgi:hypothetical protein
VNILRKGNRNKTMKQPCETIAYILFCQTFGGNIYSMLVPHLADRQASGFIMNKKINK